MENGKNESYLEIVWAAQNANSSSNSHRSVYSFDWLKKHGVSSFSERDTARKAPALWEASQIRLKLFSVDYNDFMNDEASLFKTLEALSLYGLAFVKSVPTEDQEVRSVVQRIGPIRNSFYGETWDVKSVPKAKNIAYTPLYLGLHMDLMYFEAPPGLQFLHCLKNSVKGGESLFSDSFKAAALLKKEKPHSFETLCRVPVTFHYDNNGKHYHFRRPTIIQNPLNEYMYVYYAPPFQGTLEIPFDEVDGFYTAFRDFEEILAR